MLVYVLLTFDITDLKTKKKTYRSRSFKRSKTADNKKIKKCTQFSKSENLSALAMLD